MIGASQVKFKMVRFYYFVNIAWMIHSENGE